MTLSDLASIGSFVSALAVLVSLVYLALQMRQSARNQMATIHHERTALAQENILRVMDAEMTEVWMRGQAGDEQLDDVQSRRYIYGVLASLWLFEEYFWMTPVGDPM